jgi:hypothetical protein
VAALQCRAKRLLWCATAASCARVKPARCSLMCSTTARSRPAAACCRARALAGRGQDVPSQADGQMTGAWPVPSCARRSAPPQHATQFCQSSPVTSTEVSASTAVPRNAAPALV